MAALSFDIVLPCYNPHNKWHEIVLGNVTTLKKNFGEKFNSLIIVNDGSSFDLTPNLVENNFTSLIWIHYENNKGKGHALREGVAKSVSDICFYTDLDFPFGVQPFHDAYQKLSNGSDIVMGLRDQEYYDKLPFKRMVISHITNLMNRMLLRLPFNDAQAGLKGFNKSGKEVFLKTKVNSFLFDTEFILLAKRHKLKISTVPVTPRLDVHFSSMKIGILIKELGNFIQLLRNK